MTMKGVEMNYSQKPKKNLMEVTIKIKDTEDGKVDVSLEFNPPAKADTKTTKAAKLAVECMEFIKNKSMP
jgi:hypothetical protein